MIKDLYNRIRPREFKDMLPTSPNFLNNIDELVEDALEGRPGLPHVMIFHSNGTPGLGKTTCARILTVKLNPLIDDDEKEAIYNGDASIVCTEVNATEMDKKSVKSLVENMMLARDSIIEYNYVYIINEAHKLTSDSAQVLLSIEDMPSNVYVIMTTTDSFAVREDLVSRIRTYTFKTVPNAKIVAYLKRIADEHAHEYSYSNRHEVVVTNDLLESIAAKAGGSLRRSIMLLEQLLASGEIDSPLDADIEEKELNKRFFYDFLELWAGIFNEKKTTSWGMIVEKFNIMTSKKNGRSGMAADDFRRSLLYRIQWNISSDNVIKEGLDLYDAYIYRILSRYMMEPITYPAETQLLLRLYLAYMEVIDLRESSPAQIAAVS